MRDSSFWYCTVHDIIICTVEEQAGDRWFLEKIRYDAGSSPVARSRADFIAGCYKMWRHSLARLMDISYRNGMHVHSCSCIYHSKN